MSTPCVTCAHPDREAIDRALVLGQESMRSLARQHGMDRASLARHRAAHLSPALTRVVADREEAGARSALARLERLATAVEAAVYGSEALPPALVRELRGTLDTIARITGELNERPQVAVFNLHESGEFLAAVAALQSAVAPFPEARAAVGTALARLSAARALPPGGGEAA